jgi:uncharacterized membrane protein YfcA
VPGLIIGLSSVISGIWSAKLANKVNEQLLGKMIGTLFVVLGAVMTVLYLK